MGCGSSKPAEKETETKPLEAAPAAEPATEPATEPAPEPAPAPAAEPATEPAAEPAAATSQEPPSATASAPLVEDIMSAFKQAQGGTSGWVRPYKAAKDRDSALHQFIFFVKPEATAVQDGVQLAAILQLILERFQGAVEIGAVRVLSGEDLDKSGVIGEHYGVISNISRKGMSALTTEAREQLESEFKEDLAAGAKVLGAHQFLAMQPKESPDALTAYELRVFNDNLGTKRLGPGSYVMKLSAAGTTYLLLNPFHPFQLVPYTASGNAIIVMEGVSSTSWAALRSEICGATDPAQATAGSIRNLLLTKAAELGLAEVGKSTNGCHMSAGPLEALVELRRFFKSDGGEGEVAVSATCFGSLLLQQGVSEETIVGAFTDNANVESDGKTVSAFDLTEEVDAAASALLLSKASVGASAPAAVPAAEPAEPAESVATTST